MQQPPSMYPLMPSFPPSDITTEQIQKYLDENKKLILAILDNQNLGKLAECAQYQAQLQKNLMYLAAIADAQPQTPPMPSPMSLHPAMQQGVFYMAQQAGMFQQRLPFSSPHPLQDPNNQQSHPQGQLTLRSTNGVDPPHSDANLGGASSSIPTSNYKPGSRGDGPGKSTGGGGGGDAEEAK